MHRKIIVVILSILLIVVPLSSLSCSKKSTPATVTSPLVTLDSRVTALDSRMGQVESKLAGMPTTQPNTEAIKSDVAGAKSDIASIKSDLASIKSDTASLKTTDSSISSKEQADVTSLTTKIEALIVRIAALETKVVALITPTPTPGSSSGAVSNNILDIVLTPILAPSTNVYISGVALDTISYKNTTTGKSLPLLDWEVYVSQTIPRTGVTGKSCTGIYFSSSEGLDIPVKTVLTLKLTLTLAYRDDGLPPADFAGWKIKAAFEDEYDNLSVSVTKPIGGIIDAGAYNFTVTINNGG